MWISQDATFQGVNGALGTTVEGLQRHLFDITPVCCDCLNGADLESTVGWGPPIVTVSSTGTVLLDGCGESIQL